MPFLIAGLWGLLTKLFIFLIPLLGGLAVWGIARGLVTFFTIAGIGVATFGGSFFAIGILEDTIADSLLGLDALPMQMSQGVLHIMDLMQFDFALSAILTALSIRVSLMLSQLMFTRRSNSAGRTGGWGRPVPSSGNGTFEP